jgi:hypothetical protein
MLDDLGTIAKPQLAVANHLLPNSTLHSVIDHRP